MSNESLRLIEVIKSIIESDAVVDTVWMRKGYATGTTVVEEIFDIVAELEDVDPDEYDQLFEDLLN